jgi:hypothetical protein
MYVLLLGALLLPQYDEHIALQPPVEDDVPRTDCSSTQSFDALASAEGSSRDESLHEAIPEVASERTDEATGSLGDSMRGAHVPHNKLSPRLSHSQGVYTMLPWLVVLDQLHDVVPLSRMTEMLTSSGNAHISAEAIFLWYCGTFWSLCCMAVTIAYWVPLVVVPLSCICSPAGDSTSLAAEVCEFILACVLVIISTIGVACSSFMLHQGPVWLVLLMLALVVGIQILSLQAPGPSFLEFVFVVVLSPIRGNYDTLTSYREMLLC